MLSIVYLQFLKNMVETGHYAHLNASSQVHSVGDITNDLPSPQSMLETKTLRSHPQPGSTKMREQNPVSFAKDEHIHIL